MLKKQLIKNLLLLMICLLCLSCAKQNKKTLPGYIEGEYTYIASGIAGTLLKIHVVRGQPIKKDALLYNLDPQPDLAFMESAKSNVEQLEPQVSLAKITLQRQKDLYTSNNTSKATLDQAQSDYDSKVKQLNSSQHVLTQAEWALQQKTIYSPITGYVFDTFFRVGEKVAANQPVLALLAPENIRVLFYMPEKQLSKIHLGQKITFTCDGCPKGNSATISYISPEAEYTPPIIYSQDTRYKLVFLIRATMSPNLAVRFHPGQPVDIDLNVQS